MSEQPTRDADEQGLFQRLLDGDVTASGDLAVTYYDDLYNWLAAAKPGLDPHYYQMAADDALIDLFQRPHTYDSKRSPLRVFLRVAARNRLLNILRTERRHSSRRALIETVEVLPVAVKYGHGEADDDPAEIVERREHIDHVLAHLSVVPTPQTFPESVTAYLSSTELEVLKLHVRRERKTLAFARAMGITDLPPAEQRTRVKRLRDKLEKRLKRAGVDI